MLIVEGPDNAGKSTLIRMFETEFNLPSFHAGGPPKSSEDILKRRAAAYRNCLKRIIQDRNYFISDIVYGSVLRKDPCYQNFSLMLKMLQLKPLVIYCRPSMQHLMQIGDHKAKAHETQEHVDKVKENQKELVWHYDALMSIVAKHTTVLQYDFAKGFNAEQMDTLRNFIDCNEDFYERAVAEIS